MTVFEGLYYFNNIGEISAVGRLGGVEGKSQSLWKRIIKYFFKKEKVIETEKDRKEREIEGAGRGG